MLSLFRMHLKACLLPTARIHLEVQKRTTQCPSSWAEMSICIRGSASECAEWFRWCDLFVLPDIGPVSRTSVISAANQSLPWSTCCDQMKLLNFELPTNKICLERNGTKKESSKEGMVEWRHRAEWKVGTEMEQWLHWPTATGQKSEGGKPKRLA